jgi:4-diphosphocytidyl-2-C-methyl-D-erythritol kinase
MICFPNAKINLGLHVTSRRPDGYHNLETIFYPLALRDALEIIPRSSSGSGEHRFFLHGNAIEGAPTDNLVMKALRLISAEKDIPPIDVHLLKRIPTGAGLGGGSADAAFMLRLLNDSLSLGYTNEQLQNQAAQLGADCSFFIHNTPAYAIGIGDILEPIEVNLDGYFLLLVKPDITVCTKDAYGMITPKEPDISLKEIVKKPVEEWKDWMKNDFEIPVFKKYPEIWKIKQQMIELGANYASMSGSGSAVFGIFREEPNWHTHFNQHFVWTSKSRPTDIK